MIAETEAAVADYLRDKLTADESLATGTWQVLPATTVTTAPKSKALIVVAAQSVPQSFPSLIEAMIEVTVVSPADVSALATAHTLAEQAVANAFSTIEHDDVASTISSEITARLADWEGAGIYVTGWQSGRSGSEYTPHFTVKVGVRRVAV
jgi:phosphoserine aminotransferase